VISVMPPDAKAASKLVRLYARGLVSESEDLSEVGTELDGQIPAVIREVVERSKLAAISRLKEGEALELISKDLVVAARGMKHHLELMAPPKTETPTKEEAFGLAAKDLLGLNGHAKKIEYTEAASQAITKYLKLQVPAPAN
jgi:hypothetical protein